MWPHTELYGRVHQLTNRSVFKLGLVVGPSRACGKVRVRPWSAAQRSFCGVQVEDLGNVAAVDAARLTARQRAVYQQARAASYLVKESA